MRLLLLLIFSLFWLSARPSAADSLISLLPQKKGAEKTKLLSDITWELSFSDVEKAREYGEKGLKLARELRDESQIIETSNTLGVAYYRAGRFQDALKVWNEALQLEKKNGETRTKASLLSKIGLIYKEEGKIDGFMEMSLESIRTFEAIGDSSAMAHTYSNIASALRPLKQYDKMMEYSKKAVRIFEELGEPYGLVNAYGNLALAYRHQSNPDSAIIYIEKSLESALKVKLYAEAAANLNNLGAIYSDRDEYAKAGEKYREAYEMMLSENKTNASMYLANYAKMLNRQEQYSAAIPRFHDALSTASSENIMPVMAACLEGLADSYAGTGNFEKAFYYKSRERVLADSMISIENAKKIAELETRFDTETKKKEIKLLNHEKEIQSLKISEQDARIETKNAQIISLGGGAFLILLTGIFGYLWFRTRQKKLLNEQQLEEQKNRLKAVIEAQEKERARIAKDLHDGVGQLLSAAKMNYSNIQESIKTVLPDRMEDYETSTRILDDACSELRTISHQMMPRVLRENGLREALRELVHATFSRTGIHCELDVVNLENRFRPELEVGVFRIVQEIIANILKHSGAKKVSIHLMNRKDRLVLLAEDDGKGFDPELVKKGAGLDNISTRVEALNGFMQIERGPVNGTVITCRFAVESASESRLPA